MNAFYTLPPLLRSMFATMLFVSVIGETALLIYKAHRSVRFAEKLVSLLALFILFAALILFPQYGDADTGLCRLPWIPVAVLLFLAAIHLSIAIPMERKRLFERITPDSIREATNALTMGICFADPAGRIILCNETMRELSYMMTGSYPQMIGELDTVLFPAGPDGKRSSNGTFFFPDGNVRLFNSEQITVSGEKGWRQITAQDITELHRVKEQLESENRRLAETNRKLRAMYDRMTDDIREKESLEMKIRTHDTMGRSLITIQDIMENADEADKKLAALLDPDWGVDVIIGGHSHTKLEEPFKVNDIYIVQAGTGTDEIGRFDIMVDTDLNAIDTLTWQMVPIDDAHCPRDEEVENFIQRYRSATSQKYDRIITRFSC